MLLWNITFAAVCLLLYAGLLALQWRHDRSERVLGLLLAGVLAYYPFNLYDLPGTDAGDWQRWALLVPCWLPLLLGLYHEAARAHAARRQP